MKTGNTHGTTSRVGRHASVAATLLLAAASTSALAGNRTFTGVFDGSEDTMPSTLASCASDGSQSLGYLVGGTFQVDTSGAYRVADAGNVGFGGFGGIQDASVILYEGSFDPNNPASNRIASVDISNNAVTNEPDVGLDSGTDYILVIQHWCASTEGAGPWGAVIEGPGSFSGAGFPSGSGTFGNWSNVTDTTRFGVGQAGNAIRKYVVSRTFSPETTGQYAFVDVSDLYQAPPAAILVYEGAFDPDNPASGFIEDLGFAGILQLESDKSYSVVLIDAFEANDRFQSVVFAAGVPGMGTHLNGSWYDRATSGQGMLLDYAPGTAGGFLFLAWFTFDTPDDSGVQSLGDSSQRWLTASGIGPLKSTGMDIMFANTTGGVFNERAAAQATNGEYGVGSMTIDDCAFITLDFELPDGNDGSVTLQRGLMSETERCYEETGVGPLIR